MADYIDCDFDFRVDAGGKDPDFASPTLRPYHRILWVPRGELGWVPRLGSW